MKPNFETAVTHEGTFGADRIPFEIDVSTQAARSHLMGILTDTYEDPVAAAIREPATNAYDSHIAAKQTKPVEVILPSAMDPTYVIKDFGVGMSIQDITENYIKFLWSSKRDNDEEAGMLGLGCKAPLTYVSQFTVVARKNGWQTTVLVSRGDDGNGGLEPVEHSATNKPDGVEVYIPVNSGLDEFLEKAKFFFGFWSEGSVLLNGKPPASHFDHEDARCLDPDVALTTHLPSSYVVMGNVPYRAREVVSYYGSPTQVLARVPIGAVDFPPNRESLRYTTRTYATLETIKNFVGERLLKVAQDDVDSQPTPRDAMKAMRAWRKLGHRLKLTYRGKTPPSYVNISDWGFSYNPYRDVGGKFGDNSEVMLTTLEEGAFVLGFPMRAFVRSHKDKLFKYLEDRDGKVANKTYFIGEKLPESYWLEGAEAVQWEEVSKVKLPPKVKQDGDGAAPKKKRGPTFDMVTDGGYIRTLENPDLSGKVIIVSGSETTHRAMNAKEAFPGEKIVILHPNRVDKFMRENKGAIMVDDAGKVAVRRLTRKLSEYELSLLASSRDIFRHVIELDSNLIDDPKIKRFVAIAQNINIKNTRRRIEALNRIVGYAHSINIYRMKLEENKDEKYILAAYPLLSDISWRAKDKDVIQYMNALYSTRQRGK